ncbi:MAG: (2Fe-2S) ferredoxin domain-containing protein [Chitinivibrionales bacterium]|nr:(2Fe-2S) ferredoxin domain-containing protein [Chitinivibrionales bacterium]MBD3356999.1 (2Fe-2S) ferredoxin domain-containing protein [Chitinivibrionales bacterium]
MNKNGEIIICMGSSCYSRGNNNTLAIIQNYLAQKGLSDTVMLKGALCRGACKNGPNISVNGKQYSEVAPDTIPDILNHHFQNRE